MRTFLALCAVLVLAAPAAAQTPAQMDTLRAEAVRSRGFARASVTQLTKFIDMLDRMATDTVVTPPDTTTPPPPPDTTTPPPPPDTVPDPPQDPSTVLVLDWDTGEFTDGGQVRSLSWTGDSGGFVVNEGGGFSTPQHLDVLDVGGGGWTDGIAGPWPAPAVGQTVTVSFEIAWVTPQSGQTTHGFYFDSFNSPGGWGPTAPGLSIEDSGSFWQVGVWLSPSADPDPGPLRMSERYPLRKGERYDFALSYTRTGQSTFTAGFSVSQGGAILYDSSDFCDSEWYSGYRCLHSTEFTQSRAASDHMTGFRIGNNGLDSPYGGGPIVQIANLRVTVR